jgi:apolipoprotein D and lipocalin family protein
MPDRRRQDYRGAGNRAHRGRWHVREVEGALRPAFLSFLPFVWGDYWIVGLADDYSWAVVGSPSRAYLWILARTSALDAGRYATALSAARANHFDVSRLVMTRQPVTGVRAPR